MFVVVAILLLFNVGGFAQQKKAAISFSKDVYNFGTVKEQAGLVNVKFKFTNTGGENLLISNVKADYGIKIKEWPREAIVPGGKGTITATFNPVRNTGKINKRVTVFANTNPTVKTLNVQGTVTPKPKTIADEYTRTFGSTGLRLKKTYLSLGNVMNTAVKKEQIPVVNTSIAKMKLTFKNVPKYMSVKAVPEDLKPNEKGVIEITYDASKNVKKDGKQNWGAQNNRFQVVINGDVQNSSRNSISVRSTIKEDFSKLSEKELAKAPKIEFKELVYDFGEAKQGDVIKHDFEFKNTGERDLEIRHVKGSWGCTAVSKTNGAIKKGETGVISVSFNSRGKRNKQHKTITVNTNDPKNQTLILKMTGNVVVPAKPANATKAKPGKPNNSKKATKTNTGAPVKKNTVH